MKKIKIKCTDVRNILKFFGIKGAPLRSFIAILFLGISLGVAYEETVGIGTWHSYHPSIDKVNICFTPPSGCGSLIAREIAKAKANIYVQAYGLTSRSIIYQLKAAKQRGVSVRVLLDGGNLSDNESIYQDLTNSGAQVYFDKMPGIAHNKVMVINKSKVITGSFNFTNAADSRNAENVLLVDDVTIAAIYLENWQNRLKSILEKKKSKIKKGS